ncbi:HIRAN domain-containing protein [Ornithinimicrobium flavum]|uniref:HIRAN domain-containing protein n=1 Tax=Ornithinimicrobium flavum TaxID=1288636 RepID=UPI0013051B86|nr:HIRAN domain-containing protein [Ornithinimicrobium flavum]
MPPLHLIPYTTAGDEDVLTLCEDSTGLLVGPKDRRLQRAGIFAIAARGEAYHKAACQAGDFSPGASVRLVREPDNEHDPNAVAILAEGHRTRAAYVNKGKARSLAKILDKGIELRAISLRGTASGRVCDQITVLAAAPEVVEHLLSPRPDHLPRPAHLG